MEKMKNIIWVFTINKIINNFDNNNDDSESKPLKFTSFLLLMDQNIPSNSQLWL